MKPLKMIRYILLSLLLIGMPLADTAVLVFANDMAPIEYEEALDFEEEELAIPDEIVAETEEDNLAPLVQEDSLPDTAEGAAWESLSSQLVKVYLLKAVIRLRFESFSKRSFLDLPFLFIFTQSPKRHEQRHL